MPYLCLCMWSRRRDLWGFRASARCSSYATCACLPTITITLSTVAIAITHTITITITLSTVAIAITHANTTDTNPNTSTPTAGNFVRCGVIHGASERHARSVH